MAWDWWTKKKRRIKRFRIHEDFQHITAVESRRRAWAFWWALAAGLTLAAWALFAPLDSDGRELTWTIFAIVIGLPLFVSFVMLSLNHLIRVDRRDRTVVHAHRFGMVPFRLRRFEMNAGYLRPTETVVSEKIPTESNTGTALGCLGLIFGPL
ncbi:MAG: hypothetical protein R3236_04455, partial [Phycisphaeraceae bacterium]|nr:hypothetical protein [Phycisphaeraceae bacterium]